MRCGAIMPDHIHLLVELGPDRRLADCIRLCKGRLATILRKAGLGWQEGYYEHRMREQEDPLPVFLYIYLNPYRADLLAINYKWPGYFCAPADWKWFSSLTAQDLPHPQWLE